VSISDKNGLVQNPKEGFGIREVLLWVTEPMSILKKPLQQSNEETMSCGAKIMLYFLINWVGEIMR
jgi:hypothetical protein